MEQNQGPAGSDSIRIRLWGTRGTLPVSGTDFQQYGGNTTCIEVRCGDHTLLFDAGSGLLPAGQALKAEGISDINLFFSHSHYDHIIGFPYFTPIFQPNTSVTLWSGHLTGKMTTREMLGNFMMPPWFPAPFDICCAKINCRDFRPGDALEVHPGLFLKTGNLNHPGGAVGYRIEWKGRAVAIITDTEHEPGVLDPNVMELIRDTEVFLYDCTYTDDEMERYRGYGHSSWQHGIRLARVTGAKKVGFIHHAQWRTDPALDIIDQEAKAEFDGAFAAYDGQILVL